MHNIDSNIAIVNERCRLRRYLSLNESREHDYYAEVENIILCMLSRH